MQIPLELSFRGFEPEESLKDLVREKAEGLDKVHNNIIACRVAVEKIQSAQDFGNPESRPIESFIQTDAKRAHRD